MLIARLHFGVPHGLGAAAGDLVSRQDGGDLGGAGQPGFGAGSQGLVFPERLAQRFFEVDVGGHGRGRVPPGDGWHAGRIGQAAIACPLCPK